jgi:hypothetical protein
MTHDDHPEMVRLTTAANSFQAHLWQESLQEAGIRCQVLGDFLEAGIGDIPGLSVEVWVDPNQLNQAEAILRDHHRR